MYSKGNSKIPVFDNLAEMVNAPLVVGQDCILAGNVSLGDGHAGQYRIVAAPQTASFLEKILITNGNYAILEVDSSEKSFDTVALLTTATYLRDGQEYTTKGYTTAGDGGDSPYLIKTVAQAALDNDIIDGYGNHALAVSGLVAVLQPVNSDISASSFGASKDGVTDDTIPIQKACDYAAHYQKALYVPEGVYLITSTITIEDNFRLYGKGDETQFLVNSDIKVFSALAPDTATAREGIEIEDLFINKTVSGLTTEYDIYIENPNICTIENVHIKSGHADTDYSNVNLGGIFLGKIPGATVTAFMNQILNCWLQNNCIHLKEVTDSTIKGGFVWGHTRPWSIRIEGGGANAVENVLGLICSKFNGGIWIDGVGVNQIRIIGNEFDGNPLLDTGIGVYSPQSSIAVVLSGNTLWGCDQHGIFTTDPIGWTISGNTFWKNNAGDNSYDDIRIIGETFQPNGNVVSGNTFTIDESRVNKGYAIREVNNGFDPVSNTYTGNGVIGSTGYNNPCILILSSATVMSNIGVGSESVCRLQGDILKLSSNGINVNKTEIVAPGGALSLPIDSSGFVGILTVSAVRQNFPTQSRRQVYLAFGHAATGSFVLQGTQDGLGGGSTFTVTMVSPGVILVTDTSASGSNIDIRVSFNGTTSY